MFDFGYMDVVWRGNSPVRIPAKISRRSPGVIGEGSLRSSDEFVKAMQEQFDKLNRDLELSLSKPSSLLGLWAFEPLQDTLSKALDTEGLDGEDPWSQ